MQKTRSIVLVAMVFVAGCDAYYARRIDVLEGSPGGTYVASKSDAVALAVVRQYAAENDIECDDNGKLPIECWRQPIRIWAMAPTAMWSCAIARWAFR